MKWEEYIGTEIGGHRLEELIGRGSFGAVYRALQLSLEREVAVKVHLCPVAEDGSVDQASLKQILSEAKILAKFAHPNIVKVYNSGVAEGTLYLVMELLEGKTLAEVIQNGKPVNLRDAVHVALEITKGLTAAHKQGIVHRDLKPSNVIILPKGKVKILDFGLADVSTGQSLGGERVEGGTPEYMAPEQWRRVATDPRTDLYALGGILFRMLTGRSMWKCDRVDDWMQAHLKQEAPDAREFNAKIPEGLARIIKILVQKDPLTRPEGAHEVMETLQRLQHKHEDLAPKGGPKTILCDLCETPNPPTNTECKGCRESLQSRDISIDDLLPDAIDIVEEEVLSAEVVEHPTDQLKPVKKAKLVEPAKPKKAKVVAPPPPTKIRKRQSRFRRRPR